MKDLFCGIKNAIDFDLNVRKYYETKVVRRAKLLDIGGRNSESKSRKRINALKKDVVNVVVSTDIYEDYGPDLVDDICYSKTQPNSFYGIYCDAVLEHVEAYWLAIENIYSIPVKGGEAFIYVPFIYPFHGRTDYHRFTFTELARITSKIEIRKIFVTGKDSGFGFILWYIGTFGAITKFPFLHSKLALLSNNILKALLFLIYNIKNKYKDNSFLEFSFFYTYLAYNHGFCAYVKK
jgi:hypothetical protein